ncbi:hypothetical protein LX32DRAFT_89962 [Colletotrichum zoysiae]|uniref:Uncharacterized protein n=1 Tax=Colletotrichum zoysiae TaxID=1216348 RepID=A0AAD9HSG9_9PEZI|nr:hypothetical protein LX32DRAFT_89962 [Colletotrichum zoysiae]
MALCCSLRCSGKQNKPGRPNSFVPWTRPSYAPLGVSPSTGNIALKTHLLSFGPHVSIHPSIIHPYQGMYVPKGYPSALYLYLSTKVCGPLYLWLLLPLPGSSCLISFARPLSHSHSLLAILTLTTGFLISPTHRHSSHAYIHHNPSTLHSPTHSLTHTLLARSRVNFHNNSQTARFSVLKPFPFSHAKKDEIKQNKNR